MNEIERGWVSFIFQIKKLNYAKYLDSWKWTSNLYADNINVYIYQIFNVLINKIFDKY